jgi:hypothetical protein
LPVNSEIPDMMFTMIEILFTVVSVLVWIISIAYKTPYHLAFIEKVSFLSYNWIEKCREGLPGEE